MALPEGFVVPEGLGLEQEPPEVQEAFLRGYFDLPWYAEHAPLMVLDKEETNTYVPMRLRYAQRYVWAACWEQARHMPVRKAIVKARQLGMTTMFLGQKVHVAETRVDREMYVLLHDLKPARSAFNRMHRMVTKQSELPGARITTYQQDRLLGFETGSNILVESTKKMGVGRSETLHHVHATEIPSWENPEDTMDGIEESVPEVKGFETSIILESTSKGVGDWWYHTVMAAYRQRGAYQLIFLPWWIEPAYGWSDFVEPRLDEVRRKPRQGEHLADVLREPLMPDEEKLGREILERAPGYGIHGLSIDEVVGKLLWRRRKMLARGAKKFPQEYPHHLLESFQGTGRPVFNASSVSWHRDRVDDDDVPVVAPATATFEIVKAGDPFIDERGKIRTPYEAREKADGEFAVWKGYEDGSRYVVGVDGASGEAEDYSAIQVVKVAPQLFEQVARWHGHVGGIELAYLAAYIAIMYGRRALLVPESTGIGDTVTKTLAGPARFPGMRLYQREVIGPDGKSLVKKFGFDMNVRTRKDVIEELYSLLDDPHGTIIRCQQTMEEIEAFRYDKDGKPDHPDGGFSDLLMALGFCAYARNQVAAPKRKPSVKRGASYEASKEGARPRVRLR